MSPRRVSPQAAHLMSAVVLILLLLPAALARAQTGACPPLKQQELREPPVIEAKGGKIDTTFKVRLVDECTPATQEDATEANVTEKVRAYVYPDPAHPGKWISGAPSSVPGLRVPGPGPTLRLRKPSAPGGAGDRLEILLVNELPADKGHQCNSACPTGTSCTCPAQASAPQCCQVDCNQSFPDCFHGDNTTNLHFHGTHVSPQPPQDYVLLELRPKAMEGRHEHGEARGIVAYGQYHYKVSPFLWTQPEGTHWYHPHKHGSTALQVANGMAGALLIEGPFDDWLRRYYGGALKEKLLILQEIQQKLNLFTPGASAPPTLVNGQLEPKITVRAGEVQRWRIVNATMRSMDEIAVRFPPGVEVRQIAMDGIQFSPENYAKQPLFLPTYPNQFKIAPGNRADFLVLMPKTAGTFEVREKVFARLAPRTQEQLERRQRALQRFAAPGAEVKSATEAPIFSVVVEEPPAAPPGVAAKVVATGFPDPGQWPKLPEYLRAIREDEITGRVCPIFEMTAGAADPAAVFKIDGVQYRSECVNVTTRLDTDDEWLVQNSTGPLHPFHIHTNPFQLVEQGTMIDGQPVAFASYDPGIWQDTIALPSVDNAWDVPAGPLMNQADAEKKCPDVCAKAHSGKWNGQWATTVPGQSSVCGCTYTGNGYVRLRHRYTEFTGEYVLHCHFLGHEDRGMMFGVQTVCEKFPDFFGNARPGGRPECVQGNLKNAAPKCGPAPVCKPMASVAAWGAP